MEVYVVDNLFVGGDGEWHKEVVFRKGFLRMSGILTKRNVGGVWKRMKDMDMVAILSGFVWMG